MAMITRLLGTGFRHLRSEPSFHVLQYRGGRLKRSGRGLAFWFHPLSASIAEIPCNDRDETFLFHARSSDFQDVTAQGTISYRVQNPETLAARQDFSIDLKTGRHNKDPLDQISQLLIQAAQQHAWDYLASTPVREVLANGVATVRDRVLNGLRKDESVIATGLEIVGVRVSGISPTAELEKALQAPVNEQIQQTADEAIFQRRALAVEKERAIQENELQNKIELARREADLIARKGANERQQMEENAAAMRIDAEATAERKQLDARVRAESIEALEKAKNDAERERMLIYREMPAHVLVGLAAQQIAGKLDKIEHINITPDQLGAALAKLASIGSLALENGTPGSRPGAS